MTEQVSIAIGQVSEGDNTILQPGMVLSSEPGVYIPGQAGYRISDTVLVTDDGPVHLTAYPARHQ